MNRNRIKELRVACGLTQEKLALEMGVVKQTVSEWETNDRLPRQKAMIDKLATRFGVSVGYLLGLSEDPQPA